MHEVRRAEAHRAAWKGVGVPQLDSEGSGNTQARGKSFRVAGDSQGTSMSVVGEEERRGKVASKLKRHN